MINLLTKLIPYSLQQDDILMAMAEAIEIQLVGAYSDAESLYTLSIIDNLPEPLLDILAYEKHIDFYESTLPIDIKRELIKNNIRFHRKKGTPYAVEELISTVFGDGYVEEWFEYNGDPYFFKVITNNTSVTNEQALDFIKALNSIKNIRSWLEKVEINSVDDHNLFIACVFHMGENLTLKQVT